MPKGTAPESATLETIAPAAAPLEEPAAAEDDAGDAPGPCPDAAPEGAVTATVEEVVDGDTFEVDREIEGTDTVRLVGVDTPETVAPDGPPEPYGEEASAYAERVLEGRNVALLPGDDPTDDYGRLLAYAWSEDGFFNLALLREGYARLMTIEPNTRYKDCFAAAEERARTERLGLWAPDDEKPSGEARENASSPRVTAALRGQYDPRDPDSRPPATEDSPERREPSPQVPDRRERAGREQRATDDARETTERGAREGAVSSSGEAARPEDLLSEDQYDPQDTGSAAAEEDATPPEGTAPGAASYDDEGPAILPATEQPPGEAGLSNAAASPVIPAVQASPEVIESLPSAAGPAGERVPVLPDTGGPGAASLLLAVGFASLVAGVVLAVSLRTGRDRGRR